ARRRSTLRPPAAGGPRAGEPPRRRHSRMRGRPTEGRARWQAPREGDWTESAHPDPALRRRGARSAGGRAGPARARFGSPPGASRACPPGGSCEAGRRGSGATSRRSSADARPRACRSADLSTPSLPRRAGGGRATPAAFGRREGGVAPLPRPRAGRGSGTPAPIRFNTISGGSFVVRCGSRARLRLLEPPSMQFRLLGPLELRRDDGTVVPLPRLRQRALLVVLLLRRGEPVSTGRLLEDIWGEHPPRTARESLQNAVSQLRKHLGGELLVTRPSGYALLAE